MLWLAIVAVAFSVVGAFYYLRVVKLMYFDEPVERRDLQAADGRALRAGVNGLARAGARVVPGACCSALVRERDSVGDGD